MAMYWAAMARNAKEQDILNMFFVQQMAPSQIDRVMKLPEGTAHKTIIDTWARVGEGYIDSRRRV